MTIVHGQIESLKKIRATLNQHGIYRFDSLGDIDYFQRNYAFEKSEVVRTIKEDIELEMQVLQRTKEETENYLELLTAEVTTNLDYRLNILEKKLGLLETSTNRGFSVFIDDFKFVIYRWRRSWLKKTYDLKLRLKTRSTVKQLLKTNKLLTAYATKREEMISTRSGPKLKELATAKKVVDDLYPRIAGAIGEYKVMRELEKLSDEFVLFNDFYLVFDPPIYNKKENQIIRSIQLDHLLVCTGGIFAIETKNWSKESVEKLDLRSPVDQMIRNSFALWNVLNSRSEKNTFRLKRHHWGEKELSVRNLVVMINHKPSVRFKYVKVLNLNELNNYICYFDPIYTGHEVKEICAFLDSIRE